MSSHHQLHTFKMEITIKLLDFVCFVQPVAVVSAVKA